MKPRHRRLMITCTVLAGLLASSRSIAAGGSTPIGNFGPTGIEVAIQDDLTLRVLGVQSGSPASGKFAKGDTITAINGRPPLHGENRQNVVFFQFHQLASFITEAEAKDGVLNFTVIGPAGGEARQVIVIIPVLGRYSKTFPIDCDKTDRIIAANADYLHSIAGGNGEKLTSHSMADAWAILSLLSTGREKDLELVHKVYRSRMVRFQPDEVGSHNWHNGVQGIAACEYYLRTGQESVMPLINEICEKIRKYQVQGGWSHWAKGINPQYTAGGHMNAAGVNNLTTLLLATMCDADVDEQATLDALRLFYRFVGHGATPYGNHRPEGGYGSNNAKTELVGLAMSVAARATNGDAYALARDKNTAASLYTYPHILRGHTGGFGSLWYGVASGWMTDKEPKLYHNRFQQLKWFYELSRRHDGSFGSSGSGRYDQEGYGRAIVLGLTAPRKTLQITGAPTSPYAKPFTLPKRIWGRAADTAFLTIKGGPAYERPNVPPHIERARIAELDEAGLRKAAAHPEQVYRQDVANAIRDKDLMRLTEELLESDDPLQQQTACRVINTLEPWRLRHAKDYRARLSLDSHQFTPRMFKGLMEIIKNPEAPLWSVDQALIACAGATADQIKSELDTIIPFLEHEEWFLNEAAAIALAPAMSDVEAMRKIMPVFTKARANNMLAKPRGVMGWALTQGTRDAPEQIKRMLKEAEINTFKLTPSIPDPEPGVDVSGITSVALEWALHAIVTDDWQPSTDAEAVLTGAKLAVSRIDDFRERELNRVIDLLIHAGGALQGDDRGAMGRILVAHFRPAVVGDDPASLRQQMQAGTAIGQMNKLLAIDAMAGEPGGWQMFGRSADGKQEWWHTSYEPPNKPDDGEYNRHRKIDLPKHLADWHKPDYDPAKLGWKREFRQVPAVASKGFDVSGAWFSEHIEGAGEAIFLRKTFELKDLDYVQMRLTIFSRQGYDVYLNGHKIAGNAGRSKTWQARTHYLDDKMRQHLRVGENVVAVRSFLQYFRGLDGGVDVFVEGLRHYPKVD